MKIMFHGNISQETALGLKELQKRIQDAGIPSSKLDETLNIATWNIREFGKKQRRPESLHFIAEIIGQFDLVCIVELRDNLEELQTVLTYLGPTWRVIFSDYDMDGAGNRERLAFVYDERAVRPTGLVAEAGVLRKKNAAGEYLPANTFWRSPFMVSFQAGDFDFILLSAHIRWDNEASRKNELNLLADWVNQRVNEKHGWDKDIIVVGDFNITSLDSPLYHAVCSHGLEMVDALAKKDLGSNLEKNKRYDQILHYPKFTSTFAQSGGVLDFFINEASIPGLYLEDPPTKTKFTYEMSDHLPVWVQLNTDTDTEQLDRIISKSEEAIAVA
jgi:endonuclease/exonuclease/phosphatase family metal-dependent hydrolase